MIKYLDLIIIFFYLGICLIIGLLKHTKIHNIKDYTISSGFSSIILAATVFATSISASSGIDKIGRIYKEFYVFGIPSLLIFIYWIISSKIFTERIHKFKDCISMSEIMQKLYGKAGLYLTGLCVLLDSIGFISIQIIAIGLLFNFFFDLQYEYIVTLVFLVLVIYSMCGGIKAVILIDFLQFFIFYIVFPVGIGYLVKSIGSFDKINYSLEIKNNFIDIDKYLEIIAFTFYCLMPTTAAPDIQRMLIAKNKIQLKDVFKLVALFSFLFNFMLCFIALTLKCYIVNIEGNSVFYYFIYNYIPNGIRGLIIVGMLAVMMSTADSWLNVASSTIAHDFIKKWNNRISDKNEVFIARISTILIGAIALIIALNSKKLADIIWNIRSIIQPIIFTPFIAGICGIKADVRTFIYSILTGLTTVIIHNFIYGATGLKALIFSTLFSSVTFFLHHYFKKKKFKKTQYKLIGIYFYYRNVMIKILNSSKTLSIDLNYDLTAVFFLVFLLSNIIITPIIIVSTSYQQTVIIYLRLTLTLMSLAYFINEYFSKLKLFNIYKLFILTLMLPFYSIFCYLVCENKVFWLVNLFLSIKILFNFNLKIKDFILQLLFGSVAAILLAIFIKMLINDFRLGMYHCVTLIIFLLVDILYIKKELAMQLEFTKNIYQGLAHDIKNPVSIVKDYLYLLKKLKNGDKLNDNDVDQINKIDVQIFNLCKIIEGVFLQLKHNYKIKLKKIKLIDLINDSIRLSKLAGNNSIKIINRINEDDYILVDREIMERVLCNLLNNALEAVESKSIKIIILENMISNGLMTLSIKDNGIDIEKNEINKIFTPFYSLKKQGNGLGLTFCRKMLKKMCIDIMCQSLYGKYTKFTLTFIEYDF